MQGAPDRRPVSYRNFDPRPTARAADASYSESLLAAQPRENPMNARRTLFATSTLILLGALTACERTSTPPAPTAYENKDGASSLSAPPAPSMVGTPIAEVPATHAMAPPQPDGPTARDTPANEPAATLTAQKDKNELPLAGQVNNHSSEAFKSGRDENAPAEPKPAS